MNDLNKLKKYLNKLEEMDEKVYYQLVDNYGRTVVNKAVLDEISKIFELNNDRNNLVDFQMLIWKKFGYCLSVISFYPFEDKYIEQLKNSSKRSSEKVNGRVSLQEDKLFTVEDEVHYGFSLLKRPYLKILSGNDNKTLNISMIFSSIKSLEVCDLILDMFFEFYEECSRTSSFDNTFKEFLFNYRKFRINNGVVPNIEDISSFKVSKDVISEEFLIDQVKMYIEYSMARFKFISCNIRLVEKIVKDYSTGQVEYDDLVQEGMFGLDRSLNTFDIRQGYKFSTYASRGIRNSIFRYFQDNFKTIRLPAHIVPFITKINGIKNVFFQSEGREPTMVEIADKMDMDVNRLIEVVNSIKMVDCDSLDRFVRDSSDDEDFTIERFVCDPNASFENRIVMDTMMEHLIKVIDNNLTFREKQVVLERIGYYDDLPKTLEEIGKMQGCTRERIRQIESKALRKLRRNSDIKALNPYN